MFYSMKFRLTILALISPLANLSVFAGQETIAPVAEKLPVVILVEKNGAISVAHQHVQLKDLAAKLKELGVAGKGALAVEGEPGVRQKDIERVLETLVDKGLLPKGPID
jgi:biopolymer transport protein ExbD